ncbi:MAG: hypothetical protein JMN27_17595 [gamma proteobacterium endosymbiont of Lamellibrachia anaximandri]|nr:hypothetical protein [gamma proteobacterium endosymbiont of Lamellibrachia anaximandri]MBL3535622.1 hypothetical protein [gamma proteobacterium endosymbiont of Lamellibrachia anaximandri]MBL3600212.1 hypothetical protein [gamma proteobacterium endosymbiont of Lamellibrachia anaximandri]
MSKLLGWFTVIISVVIILVSLSLFHEGRDYYWLIGIGISLWQILAFINGWVMLDGMVPTEATNENIVNRRWALAVYLMMWIISAWFLVFGYR